MYQMLYTIYSTNLAQLVPAISPIFFFQTILPTLLYFFFLSNFTPSSPHCGVQQVQKLRCPLMQAQLYQRVSLPSPKVRMQICMPCLLSGIVPF